MSALSDLEDLYPRLVDALLPRTTAVRSTENSAGFGRPDPRRAPMRVEVHDLLHTIETEVPEFATDVCDALDAIRCIAFPVNSAKGSPMVDPRVKVSLATLRRHWWALEDRLPEMAEQIENRLSRLVAKARRLLGQTKPPVPLVTPCPMCGQPTVFRLDTEDGPIVVCGNPEDRTVFGTKRQWDEYQWEEANDPRFAASAASG